jgi:hypothetical protein
MGLRRTEVARPFAIDTGRGKIDLENPPLPDNEKPGLGWRQAGLLDC